MIFQIIFLQSELLESFDVYKMVVGCLDINIPKNCNKQLEDIWKVR